MSITLIEVQPIGHTTSLAHLHVKNGPHRWENVSVPEYPPNPQADQLKRLRVSQNLTLAQTGERLGLDRVQVSQLENGRFDLSESDWQAVREAMAPKCRDCGATGYSHWKGGGEHFWVCLNHEQEMRREAKESTARFRDALGDPIGDPE